MINPECNLDAARSLLKEGIRLDGRNKIEMRNFNITFLQDYGAIDFSLGSTRVLVFTKAEASEPPSLDRPSEGSLKFYSDFSLVSNTLNNIISKERLLNRILEKTFRSSKAIDTEGLCIVAGKLVWNIRVEIKLLSFDGNFIDCACLAVLVSLMHFRRPDVTVVGESDVTIHDFSNRNPVPLCIHHMPITSTFCFFKEEKVEYCLDGIEIEEEISFGSITIAVNPQREICLLHKAGGLPCSIDTVYKLTEIAHQQSVKLVELLSVQCREDVKKKMAFNLNRVKGN